MGAVLIRTSGQRLVLNGVTGMGGAPVLTVYGDEAMSSPVTLPNTFLSDTLFWVEDGDSVWDVEASDGTPAYTPKRAQVQADHVQTLDYRLDLGEVIREYRENLPDDLILLGFTGGGSGGGGSWGAITGTLASQTDLKAALDGKQPLDADLTSIANSVWSEDDIPQIDNGSLVPRTPAQVKGTLAIATADVSGLVAALAAKVPLSTVGAANGVAPLDASSLIPSSYIPAISPFTSVNKVADSAARLALTGLTPPALAVQTDTGHLYVLTANPASTSGNWTDVTPAAAITQVNGDTGPVVNLTAASVGAAATSHAHAGADITSGTVAFARLPTGTTSSTVAVGSDTRFTDARTPTAHASTHASAGSDPVTVAQSQVTGLSTALGLLAPKLTPIITVSGTSYSATSADNGSVIVCTSSSPVTITVPASLPLGWGVLVVKYGTASSVTIAAGSGATRRAPNGARITTQYETASVACLVTNEILVDGGVVV